MTCAPGKGRRGVNGYGQMTLSTIKEPHESLAINIMIIGFLLPEMAMAEQPVYGGGWKEFKELLIPGIQFSEGLRPSMSLPLIDATHNATERTRDYYSNPTIRPLSGSCIGLTNAFGEPLPLESVQAIIRDSVNKYCQ